jgi:hypothetical protein
MACHVGAEASTLQFVPKISADRLGDQFAGSGAGQPGERFDKVGGLRAMVGDRDCATERTKTRVPGQQSGEMFAQYLHALLFRRPEGFFHVTPSPIANATNCWEFGGHRQWRLRPLTDVLPDKMLRDARTVGMRKLRRGILVSDE